MQEIDVNLQQCINKFVNFSNEKGFKFILSAMLLLSWYWVPLASSMMTLFGYLSGDPLTFSVIRLFSVNSSWMGMNFWQVSESTYVGNSQVAWIFSILVDRVVENSEVFYRSIENVFVIWINFSVWLTRNDANHCIRIIKNYNTRRMSSRLCLNKNTRIYNVNEKKNIN